MYFGYLNMPINFFGNSSSWHNNGNKFDTSINVQKSYVRTSYIEPNIEEDIDMKNQFKFKNLLCPIENSDALCKIIVDTGLNDPSIIRNFAHVETNDENLDNVPFAKVNSLPAVGEHLSPNFHVDQAISHSVDGSSFLRLDPNEKLKVDEQDSIIFISTLTSPKKIKETPTKSYVDSLQESSRNKQDLSSVFNDQDNEVDNNKLTDLGSVSVNRNPISDHELVNTKHLDEELDKAFLLRFNQTLKDYLKVSAGNDVFTLTQNDKIYNTDATFIKYTNSGGYILQNWVIKRNDKINNGKTQNFTNSTKTNSLTGSSGATSLPPIGDSFM